LEGKSAPEPTKPCAEERKQNQRSETHHTQQGVPTKEADATQSGSDGYGSGKGTEKLRLYIGNHHHPSETIPVSQRQRCKNTADPDANMKNV
jgi:hypothetical protein